MNSDENRSARLAVALDGAGVLEALVTEFELDPVAIENAGGSSAAIAGAILGQLAGRTPPGLEALDAFLDRPAAVASPLPHAFASGPRRVLVVAADLRHEPDADEVELIRRVLAEGGGSFVVETARPGTPESLFDRLLVDRPEFLHVSGLGEVEACLPEPAGGAIGARARCVVLNACGAGSPGLAAALAGDRVVSTDRAIGEALALAFVGGFYGGIGRGLDIDGAFDLGRCAPELVELPASLVPRLTHSGSGREEGSLELDRGVKGEENTTRAVPELPRRFPLWFGTNRAPVDASDPSRGFGTADDRRLHLGRCWVEVPPSHKIGELGSSLLKRLWEGADDRLKLGRIVLEAEAEYWAGLGDALKLLAPGRRSAVVLIHGFNVSFQDAALRSAQLGVDLDVPGIMAFYSWPSHERMLRFGYQQDATAVQACEPFLVEYLSALANLDGVDAVHVIAHSMGNQGLIRSLTRVVEASSRAGRVPFENIVLAAPDIDSRVFRDLAGAYAEAARRTTLYASSKDQALRASTIMNDGERAGFSPPLMTLDGIDTVDVTCANLSWLGHGEFAAARRMLDDLKALLVDGLAPEARQLGRRQAPDGRAYWSIGTEDA
ncbi:alpha/beta hydrolase [Isosphaeraceae bacterium EP7]